MSVTLLPIMVFGLLVVDGARLLGAKSIISGAGDLAMNAALTNYDSNLKDMYGLFGMKSDDVDASSYFETTINPSSGSGTYGGLIQMDSDGFSVKGVSGSEVCQEEVMTQQILEYSKYRMPLAFGEEMLEKLNQVAEKKKTADAVQKQITASQKMEEVNDICERLKFELMVHDNACDKKYTDSQVTQMETRIRMNYLTVSQMLVISSAFTYGSYEAVSGTTEERVSGFLNIVETQIDRSFTEPQNDFSSMMKAMTYQQSITSDQLTAMVEAAGSDEEEERLSDLVTRYNNNQSLVDQYRRRVEAVAKSNITSAYNELTAFYNIAKSAVSTSEAPLKTIEEIRGMLEDDTSGLLTAMKNWKSSIDQITNEKEKASQQQQYDKYQELLDTESLKDIKACVEDNVLYFEKVKAYLESFEFCDVVLLKNSDPYSTYTGYISGLYTAPDYNDSTMNSKASSFLSSRITYWSYTDTTDGMLYHNLSDHPYFKKLQEVFDSNEKADLESTVEENVSKSDEAKQGVFDGIKNLQNADFSGTVPSSWLNKSGADTSSSSSVSGGKDELASSGKSSISSSNSFLSSLASALEGGIENLYLMEYAIQMFSYYTVDKNIDGTDMNASDIVSLSGFKFSSDTTAMYKSEVEYLLWGNQNASTNVTYTASTLYGIRFMLNCVYAFTDKALVTDATTLSAAAGLGAPLLQVALLVSVALIETALDMQWILQGKPLVILKDATTWRTPLAELSSPYSLNSWNTDNDFSKLTYKDYLRIFLLLNFFSDAQQSKMLARMADCMQFNLKKNSSTLNMTKSYTMVYANGDVTVNTTFMDMVPRLANVVTSGSENQYSIHYESVLAY